MAGFGLPPLRAPYDEEDELTRQADLNPPAEVLGEVRAPLPAGPSLEPVPDFSPKPLFAPEKSFRDDVAERRRKDFEEAQSDDRWTGVAGNAIQNFYNASVGKPVEARSKPGAAQGIAQRREMEDAEAKRGARAATLDPTSPENALARTALEKGFPDIWGQIPEGYRERMTREDIMNIHPLLREMLQAQEAKLKAEAEKNAKKAKADTDATEHRQEMALKLQKNFEGRPEYKSYSEVSTAVDKIRRAKKQQSAASDMAMVYSLITSLDPGSAVKEGEYASASNTTGVPGQIMNMFNQAKNGRFLNDTQRQELVTMAEELVKAHRSRLDPIAEQTRRQAERYGIPVEDVVFDYYGSGGQPTAPTAAPTVLDGKNFFQKPDGTWEVEE